MIECFLLYKPVIVAEIRAGRQKPYYIKADGLENGVYIRVSGTTRPADRDMSRELYYGCDARSFDSVIRRDIEVTDEDIKKLCEQMKEVAIANSKSNLQRSAVKDVTKNVLLSWGILKKDENEKIYPTNAYMYLTGQGGLLPGVTIDLMKEGFSKIRNRSLANAFAYMNLVEAWGSGVPKLMQAMKEYGLREPEFIDMEVAFRINLYRDTKISLKDTNEPNNDTNKPKNDTNDTKTDLEIRLAELIRKNPEMPQREMKEALNVSIITIKRTLSKMQMEGKVIREGSKRKGKWILIS